MAAARALEPVCDAPLGVSFVRRVGRGELTTEVDAFVARYAGRGAVPMVRRTAAARRSICACASTAPSPRSMRRCRSRSRRSSATRSSAALEAAWRGVAWLCEGLPPDGMVQLRLLDVRWAELARDLERAPDFDRSALFLKIYEEEFGTPGGTPYSLLIALHEVRHRPAHGHPVDDVATLRHLATVAAAAFAPIILSASPALFGAESHGDLLSPPVAGDTVPRGRVQPVSGAAAAP